MKRFVSLLTSLILTLTMMFTLILPVQAGTPIAKETFPLYAGQTNQVGHVEVWNDDTNLYVEFFISEDGWEMTESHISVAQSVAGIPVASKTLNPVPGAFQFSDKYDPAVTGDLYTLPFVSLVGVTPSNFVIAIHAKVQHYTQQTFTPEITWTRSRESNDIVEDGNEVYFTSGYGGSWNYDGVMEAFFNTVTMDAVVWDNGSYNGRPVAGKEFASWKYAFTQPDGGGYIASSDLRLFRATFSIPENYVTTSARLGVLDYTDRIPINDNVYVYVNGEYLFWGGTRANVIGSHNGVSGIQAIGYGGPQVETDGWYVPGTFPEISDLLSGPNKIEVFTEENEGWGGLGKLVLTLQGLMYDKFDSAWAATAPGVNRINPTPKGAWGTFINYECDFCTAPVVRNGGFETPIITGGAYGLYPSSTTDLGWTVEWVNTQTGEPVLEFQNVGTLGLIPDEGNQYAELGSTHSVLIYQTIDTCPWKTYELSFAWSPRTGQLQDSLAVYWNDVLIGTFSDVSDTQGWEQAVIHNLPVTGTTAVLKFVETGVDAGTPTSYGSFLDDVRLNFE